MVLRVVVVLGQAFLQFSHEHAGAGGILEGNLNQMHNSANKEIGYRINQAKNINGCFNDILGARLSIKT